MKVNRYRDRIKLYKKRQQIKILRKHILIELPLLLIIILLFNNYFFFFVRIEENAMQPLLQQNQLCLFNKIHYGLQKPFSFDTPENRYRMKNLRRGDVVAMQIPESKPASTIKHIFDLPLYLLTLGMVNLVPRKIIIRRIIALPGDTIAIKNKKIYINHELLKPHWKIKISGSRQAPEHISTKDNLKPVFIPAGKTFVLNDNWQYLNDSRSFGLVDLYKIEGKLNQQK
ncbi:MAG TPA: signal peptidase I [Spirochaetota bacterium]|nr:signal peptidase I [Spirochaetota bacterium]